MQTLADRLFRFDQKLAIAASTRTPAKSATVSSDLAIISFSFDDVPSTAFTNGMRILDERGCRGTFFISGSLCGKSEADRCLITPEQCRVLHEAGHEIGCHTFSHKRMPWHANEDLDNDIELNAAFLAGISPTIRPQNFAYPYNTPTPRAMQRLAQRFKTCRAGVTGINTGPVDLAMLKSVEISRNGADLAEASAWIDKIKAHGGWLIFVTHDVADKPTLWGTTPEILEGVVAHAKQSGCDILTINAAADRIARAQQACKGLGTCRN